MCVGVWGVFWGLWGVCGVCVCVLGGVVCVLFCFCFCFCFVLFFFVFCFCYPGYFCGRHSKVKFTKVPACNIKDMLCPINSLIRQYVHSQNFKMDENLIQQCIVQVHTFCPTLQIWNTIQTLPIAYKMKILNFYLPNVSHQNDDNDYKQYDEQGQSQSCNRYQVATSCISCIVFRSGDGTHI